MNYRMQGHSRSQSSVLQNQQIKTQKIGATYTQSTSSGSLGSINRSKTSIHKFNTFLQGKPKISCNYCTNQKFSGYVSQKTNSYLYSKYSSSQNYYYTRDINEILTSSRTKSVILFKDVTLLDEDEEYMKRYYQKKEYPHKIKLLTEYYKFHQDIPRLFMLPTTNILNNFHDKKRRLEYYRIAKLIEDENKKNPNRPPKGIVGDKPVMKTNETESEDQNNKNDNKKKIALDNLLKDISSFVNRGQTIDDEEFVRFQPNQNNMFVKKNTSQQQQLANRQLKGLVSQKIANNILQQQQFNQNQQQLPHSQTQNQYNGNQAQNNKQTQNPQNQKRADQSTTIQELNQQLQDITNNKIDHSSYQVANEDHNLEDFLNYINKKDINIQHINPMVPQKPILIQQQVPTQQSQQSFQAIPSNQQPIQQQNQDKPKPILLKQNIKDKKFPLNLKLDDLEYNIKNISKVNVANNNSNGSSQIQNAVGGGGSESARSQLSQQNGIQNYSNHMNSAGVMISKLMPKTTQNSEQLYYGEQIQKFSNKQSKNQDNAQNQQQIQSNNSKLQQFQQQTGQTNSKNVRDSSSNSSSTKSETQSKKFHPVKKSIPSLNNINLAQQIKMSNSNLKTFESNKISPRSIIAETQISPRDKNLNFNKKIQQNNPLNSNESPNKYFGTSSEFHNFKGYADEVNQVKQKKQGIISDRQNNNGIQTNGAHTHRGFGYFNQEGFSSPQSNSNNSKEITKNSKDQELLANLNNNLNLEKQRKGSIKNNSQLNQNNNLQIEKYRNSLSNLNLNILVSPRSDSGQQQNFQKVNNYIVNESQKSPGIPSNNQFSNTSISQQGKLSIHNDQPQQSQNQNFSNTNGIQAILNGTHQQNNQPYVQSNFQQYQSNQVQIQQQLNNNLISQSSYNQYNNNSNSQKINHKYTKSENNPIVSQNYINGNNNNSGINNNNNNSKTQNHQKQLSQQVSPQSRIIINLKNQQQSNPGNNQIQLTNQNNEVSNNQQQFVDLNINTPNNLNRPPSKGVNILNQFVQNNLTQNSNQQSKNKQGQNLQQKVSNNQAIHNQQQQCQQQQNDIIKKLTSFNFSHKITTKNEKNDLLQSERGTNPTQKNFNFLQGAQTSSNSNRQNLNAFKSTKHKNVASINIP